MGTRRRAVLGALLAVTLPLGCGGSPGQTGPSSAPAASLVQTFDSRFKTVLETVTARAGRRIITYQPINDRVLTRRVTIDSDYFTLGYQTGLMARELAMTPARRTDANRELNERIAAMYRELYPPHLEKARGLASAYGLALDDLDLRDLERDFYINLYWVLFNYEQFRSSGFDTLDTGQCSILSYHTAAGASLVGRNFDYPYNVPRFFVLSNIQGVYRTLGNTGWAWNHWVMDGINEKGLFIGVATNESPAQFRALGQKPYPSGPAVNAHHMMAIVLDTCSSVEEALALVGRMRVWFSDEFLHFMVADAGGASAVIEFDADGRLVPFRSQKHYQVVTNTALQIGPENVAAQCWRYAQAERTLSTAAIASRDELLAVNRSVSVSGSARTLWITMADLGQRSLDVRFVEEGYVTPHLFTFQ